MQPTKRRTGHGKLEIKAIIYCDNGYFHRRKSDKIRWMQAFKLAINSQELLWDYWFPA